MHPAQTLQTTGRDEAERLDSRVTPVISRLERRSGSAGRQTARLPINIPAQGAWAAAYRVGSAVGTVSASGTTGGADAEIHMAGMCDLPAVNVNQVVNTR